MAPLPRTLWMSYLPIFCGSAIAHSLVPATLEHFEGLHHARLHPSQRFGEHPDFVARLGAELARLQVAEAYFVGEPRQALYPPDDKSVQHKVQRGDCE